VAASSKNLAVLLFSLVLLNPPSWGSTAHEESNWYKIGKVVGGRCQAESGKARDGCCTGGCHKAGAYKKADLGACKDGCVFYKPKKKAATAG